MPPVDRETFLAELRALPAERRAAFLAALYEARGRHVDRDGTRLRIGSPDDRTVVVPDEEATDGMRTGSDDADAVLVLEDGDRDTGGRDRASGSEEPGGTEVTDGTRERPASGDVERIDGTELHHAALYAIDRSDCERLVERFFGRSLSSFEDTDAQSDRAGSESWNDDSRDDDGRTTRAADASDGRTSRGTVGSGIASARSEASPAGSWTASGDATGRGRASATPESREPKGGNDDTTVGGPTTRRLLIRVGGVVALVAVLGVALVGSGAMPGAVLTPDPADGTDGTGGGETLTPVTPTTTDDAEGLAAELGDTTRTPGRGDSSWDMNHNAVIDTDRETPGSGSETESGSENGRVEPVVQPAGNGSARLPPGVSTEGEIDQATLAEAHLDGLANRSFRLTVVHREFVDGRPIGMSREVVRAEGSERFRVDTYASGEFRTTPVSLEGGDVYANGSTTVRRADSDRSGPLPRGDAVEPGTNGRVPYGDSVDQYLRWYLSVEESTIVGRTTVDGQPAYWLTIDGDPWVGVENTTGSVLVASDGTVRELRRSYDVPDHPETRVVVTLRVTDVGSTTVRSPGWYEGDGRVSEETDGASTEAPTSTATPAQSGDAGEDRRSES